MKLRLGDISTIYRGGSPRPIDNYLTNDLDGINWIKISDVSSDEIYVTTTKERITQAGAAKSRLVKPGDFILSNSMSYGDPHIVKINGCVHDGWLIITEYDNYFDPLYLFFAISSQYSQCQFDKMASGSTVKNLNKDKVANLLINCPSRDEQKEVVRKIIAIKNALRKSKEYLSSLNNLIISRFIKMFGDPVINNKNWPVVAVSSVLDVRGRVGWKGYTKKDLRESGPLVLGATQIDGEGKLDLSDPVYLSQEKYLESPEIFVQKNDLIFGQRGSLGVTALVDEEIGEATINPCVLILRPFDINPYFANTLLRVYKSSGELDKLNSGSSIPMISQKSIKEFLLINPPKELQNEFFNFAKRIEDLKMIVKKQVNNLQELLDAKMDEYFGKE